MDWSSDDACLNDLKYRYMLTYDEQGYTVFEWFKEEDPLCQYLEILKLTGHARTVVSQRKGEEWKVIKVDTPEYKMDRLF
jgi:hypothetical protein